MPCRIAFCSAWTRIVSATARSPLRSTETSLRKCRMRSAASARPPAAPATSRATATETALSRANLMIIDGSWFGRLERDARHRRLAAVIELEIGLGAKAEHARQQARGKRLD